MGVVLQRRWYLVLVTHTMAQHGPTVRLLPTGRGFLLPSPAPSQPPEVRWPELCRVFQKPPHQPLPPSLARSSSGARGSTGCGAGPLPWRCNSPSDLVPLQVFDSSGSFLSYINTTADPLYGPQGLALTSDGHVVVADSGNHCFKAYRYLQ